MNFTRWSARLPGTQRRAAARSDRGSVPAARAEHGSDAPTPDVEDLPVREILDRITGLMVLVHGPEHRIAYVNEAYAASFGPRERGATAEDALPELRELGLLPLLDQVLRSGKPRTVKSRKVPSGRSYTFTCTPLTTGASHPESEDASHPGTEGEAGVLLFATDVTDHAEAAERLRASERRHREAAVTLQRSLLPQELEQPDDLRIAATYQPGGADAAVGGDWYDVITLGGGRTALVIGDVMGRGVRAAAVMGQLRTAVRAYARLDLPPHEVLQLLDGLASEIDASQIATMVYAIHDPHEGRLTYASAGHLPILVRDELGALHRADEPTGPPLGTGGWLHASGSMDFPPGSTAVLYTDGLVERRSEDIDHGVDQLERALAGATGTPQVICDRLLRALGVTADHDDDVALLVLQHPEHTGPDAELFRGASLELLGGVEAAPRARAFATGVLASWRFPPELCEAGVLAASELVANSLQHGTPPMRLRLRRTDRRLIIEVTDGDDHLPLRRRAEPADEAGRGIAIVAALASNWGSRRTPGGGKAVWCEFTLKQSGAL
ncbi:ATP-binding SpoIIE family protein phosphatase [Streptomyces indicus]|uniref:Serine phosphatase RsbU, regulator of sigma subunit n=1 Tax=Streptomyces indicus TaxID=417292 RepID=A0A1G9IH11_9ACTN|nr:SpoIIE family protein phosphatase [Streptomyces indicus]SDL24511.1 Serine phosphatase RsbU, regulator of sigma subunit [Streptomyces indicus]